MNSQFVYPGAYTAPRWGTSLPSLSDDPLLDGVPCQISDEGDSLSAAHRDTLMEEPRLLHKDYAQAHHMAAQSLSQVVDVINRRRSLSSLYPCLTPQVAEYIEAFCRDNHPQHFQDSRQTLRLLRLHLRVRPMTEQTIRQIIRQERGLPPGYAGAVRPGERVMSAVTAARFPNIDVSVCGTYTRGSLSPSSQGQRGEPSRVKALTAHLYRVEQHWRISQLTML